jgi:hypothetical protein
LENWPLIKGNPVFLTIVRLVPVGGTKPSDNCTSFPVAVYVAAVTGIVEEFVKLATTVAASQRCSKQQKKATRQVNGFINNVLKYHENQTISRDPIQQQEPIYRAGLDFLGRATFLE